MNNWEAQEKKNETQNTNINSKNNGLNQITDWEEQEKKKNKTKNQRQTNGINYGKN